MKPKYYAYNPKGAAKYRKDKGKNDSGLGTDGKEGFKSAADDIKKMGLTAEKKRQSKMVMEADLNDQSKGPEAYIKQKQSASTIWNDIGKSSQNYKEFENAYLDVLSEGEVSSMFPQNVWERAAVRIAKDVWKTYKKSNKK